jgi:sulfite reductase alpha subunit
MKMESEEDLEAFTELTEQIIDWWDDNGLDHERIGETIERVGLKQFLEGVGMDVDINMVTRPRDNPYFKAKY